MQVHPSTWVSDYLYKHVLYVLKLDRHLSNISCLPCIVVTLVYVLQTYLMFTSY